MWVLPQGIVLGIDPMYWYGPGVPEKPHPEAITVVIGSDAQQMWGRRCPRCAGYFRTTAAPFLWKMTCAYCGLRTPAHHFTTPAQSQYIVHFLDTLFTSLNSTVASAEIDLDAAADAAVKGLERPTYYYDGEKQQLKFRCTECNAFTDVLGHFAFCACCGTKNNLTLLHKSIDDIRAQLDANARPSDLLKLAVSEFEGCCGDYVRLLTTSLRATKSRIERSARIKFHDVDRFSDELREVHDIDPLKGLASDDVRFADLRFHRRHVYEHRGGLVDQKYLDESGDDKRVGQSLKETPGNIRTLCDVILQMATNLHNGFHEIIPPEQKALEVLKKDSQS